MSIPVKNVGSGASFLVEHAAGAVSKLWLKAISSNPTSDVEIHVDPNNPDVSSQVDVYFGVDTVVLHAGLTPAEALTLTPTGPTYNGEPLVTADAIPAPEGVVLWKKYAFTFATVGLTTGVTVYTPAADEIVTDVVLSVTSAFNGTTPAASIYVAGEAYASVNFIGQQSIGTADGAADEGGDYKKPPNYWNGYIYGGTAALKLIIDDGAGGSPGVMTQGAGAIYVRVGTLTLII